MWSLKYLLVWVLWLTVVCSTSGQSYSYPKLLYPQTQVRLHEAYPTFSWIKVWPMPNPFVYDLKVVEVLAGQTPEAAILSNPAWYMQKGISSNLLLYPVTAPILQEGKKYAWQVVAQVVEKTEFSKGSMVLPSEVFSFELHHEVAKKVCVALSKSSTEQPVTYVIDDYVLRFRLADDSPTEGHKLSYTLKDANGKVISDKKIIPEKVQDGVYYQLPLKQFKALRNSSNKGKFFYLEGKDTPHEDSYLVRFTYH